MRPSPSPLAPLLCRLRGLTNLSQTEMDVIAGIAGEARHVAAGRAILSEGDQPERVHVLVEGWAARTKLLSDGARHFPLLLVPGDICDLDALHLQHLDYGVVALTACEIVPVGRSALLEAIEQHPAIGHALSWLTFVENSILLEAVASHGRRSAQAHLAHLLCELHARLAVVGHARDGEFAFPVTQEGIADAIGLTSVHVNRTLQGLRATRAVALEAHRVKIRDAEMLAGYGDFRPGYLHLDGMRAR